MTREGQMGTKNRKKQKRDTGTKPVSRYAQKVAAREAAEQEKREPLRTQRPRRQDARFFRPELPVLRVSATVTEALRPKFRFVFVSDGQGEEFYLSETLWNAHCPTVPITPGIKMECETQHFPEMRRPRVVRILSIDTT